MKKLIALLLCLVMALSLVACGSKQDDTQAPADDQQGAEETSLVDAAKAEGKLVVYGSCEEEYLAAACENFEKMYGIEVEYQRLSTGEVQAKIEEENGNPSADVWFGGTTDPYNVCAAEGLLEAYQAENASHIAKPQYKNADGYWYGIYKGILGFMVNKDELARMNLEAPADWQDLLKPEYKGLIWLSNYNTAGTAKLVINTMIQKYGHDEGIQYLVDLDKNIEVYTKSGSGPSKNVGTGEGTSVRQIVDEVKKVTGLPFKETVMGRRAGDPPHLIGSPKRINEEMGWHAKYNVEDIVKSAWDAWQANPEHHIDVDTWKQTD